jgi:hypothetical protein
MPLTPLPPEGDLTLDYSVVNFLEAVYAWLVANFDFLEDAGDSGGGGGPGAIDWTSSKRVGFSASPYSIVTSDSLILAAAGASADTILLLPAATGSKHTWVVMRDSDGNPHHVIARPAGSDVIRVNDSGSGSADYWCDIAGESKWFHDFDSGLWLSL